MPTTSRVLFSLGSFCLISLLLTGAGCASSNIPSPSPLPTAENPAQPSSPSSDTIQASVGTALTIGFAQNAQVNIDDAYGLYFTFANIENDSRCPNGAQCFWAGEAVIQLDASSTGIQEKQPLLLNTNGTPVEFDGYLVTLVKLTHVPALDQPIELTAYQATLLVSRKN